MSVMKRKKILPKHHTGKVVHHRHTSYAGLTAILLLAMAPVFYASHSVAQAAATDPVTTSEQVYAVVPGEAPVRAATITSLAPGAVFTTNDPVTIAGTCQNDTLLKVYKNDVFAGATFCQNGRFSVQIDLFIGLNTIIVRTFNANNVQGPDSEPIVVRHDVPGVTTTNNPLVSSGQFFITSEIFYKGINVGDTLAWPLTISGGQAPYAVSVGWGDGQTDLISRAEAGEFTVKHRYKEPGDGNKNSFNVTITATDQAGNKSFIQLVTIVSGDKQNVVGNIKQGYELSGPVRVTIQLLAIASLAVASFWFGEWRELRLMKRSTRSYR